MSQSSRSESTGDDDILPVSPGWEGSPPPGAGEGVERERREGSEGRERREGSEGRERREGSEGRERRESSEGRERARGAGRRSRGEREERREVRSVSGERSSGGSDVTLTGSVAGVSEEGEGVQEEVHQQAPG